MNMVTIMMSDSCNKMDSRLEYQSTTTNQHNEKEPDGDNENSILYPVEEKLQFKLDLDGT